MSEKRLLKVLLVDDEPYILNGLSKLIDWEACGYEIAGLCSRASAALELALATRPQLMILDIEMPGMSGLELMERLRPELPDTRFVVLSAYDLFEYAQRALHNGAYQYLLKPIDQEKLTALLAEVRTLYEAEARREGQMRTLAAEAVKNHRLLCAYLVKEALTGEYSVWSEEQKSIFDRIRPGFEYQLLLVRFCRRPGEDHKPAYPCPVALEGDLQALMEHFGPMTYLTQEGVTVLLLTGDLPFRGTFLPPLKNPVAIGVAPVRKGLDGADSLLKTLLREFAERVYWSCGSAVLSLSGEPRELPEVTLPEGTAARLSTAIGRLDQAAAQKELETLKETLLQSVGSAAQVRERLLTLCGLVYQNACALGGEPPTPPDSRTFYDTETLENGIALVDGYLRRLLAAAARSGAGQSNIVGQVKRYIQEHYQEGSLRLGEIADQNFVNYTYLSHIFKKETGVSFYQYVLDIRLGEAKRLLLSTSLPIGEIALRVGYPDSKNFHHVFKKHVGMSPNRFRESPVSRE